ncbi:MAG: hypothetical protein GY820_37660, partial [Gammaproteobacteria bacterium]|nr:hypothetical protein [Gammaproteobacteria bacterium]
MGNRQPQYQQGPQTGYGVRALQINSDGWNEGCENGGNFDNPQGEFFENDEQSQYMPNGQEQENFYSSEYNNNQGDFSNGHNMQNYSENLPVQNQGEAPVQIFSQVPISSCGVEEKAQGKEMADVKEIMGKMLNLMSESQQKMDNNSRETDRKFAELDNKISQRDFRISYEGGQIPSKNSTNTQTKSGMMHTVHSASVGMHGASSECPECQKQSAQQLRQRNQDFPLDASKNNTPNSGQIPPKSGTHLHTKSDMTHSTHSASVEGHDPSCECSECLLEKTTRIAQAKSTENFQIDASKNNTPNRGHFQQPNSPERVRRDCYEAAANSNTPMNSGDHQLQTNSGVMQQVHNVSVGMHEPSSQRIEYSRPNEQPTRVQPMRDRELLLNLTAQLNREISENRKKSALQKTINSSEEHYSKKLAHQLMDYSHYNKPNTECYGIPRGFFNEHRQPSNESDASLINPDNNNRPNTSCYGMTHEVVTSETTAAIKSVEGSVLTEISQQRQVLNDCVTDVGQQESKVEQGPKVEASAELPQTTHMQVGVMKCYSTTTLESEGSDNNCTDEVHSEQQLINVSENVEVDTVGSASLFERDQINTELELNKNHQQQQKSPYQKCRTQYMYNKLRRQRRKTMLVEVKRYKKRRGKVKFMYITKPMYVTKEVVQGGDHIIAPCEIVPAQTKNVPVKGKQLNKSYAVGSVDSPLQFSRTVRLSRANRRKRPRMKADAQQQRPNHQRLLKRTNNRN